MLQKIGFFLFGLLTLVLFSAIGIVIGFIAAQGWIKLESTGMFVRWQLLDSSHKFQHLTYANQNEVVAEAEDGKYYLYYSGPCDGATSRKCGEWVESPPGLEFDRRTKRIVESGCTSAYDYYTSESDYRFYVKPRYPPQSESNPRECAISLEHYPTGGATLTYYVLLENGKVWKWIHKSSSMQYFGTTVLWALVGLLIGIIIWFRFLKFLSQVKSRRAT